ncbi:MAG: class I SAM-dependent RNA methyltransferase [Rhizobiaceae bacterium]|nr:class I SAM-dependent RNA methyltransferase [Rhizobiaceae bacterium]
MSATFRIARLGAQGDGIADTQTGPVYVPFALPGETVIASRVKERADLVAVVEPSPQRAIPPCRHFGECGGCALQHLDPAAYLAWKRDKVVQALRGIDAPVGDIVACAARSRRRVTLSARRTEAGMLLGYSKALSHQIVDIAECVIAEPLIERSLPMLRRLAALVCATPQPFHLTVTATASGLDVAAVGGGRLADSARRDAADFAIRERIARLSADGEIIVEPAKPAVAVGTATVVPPPGAFLQAVAAAEEAMAGLVLGHVGKARRVADLFAGSGAFALRLAAQAEVHAVESDPAALAALDRASRNTLGLRRVTVEKRDLFRRPLTAHDLDTFGAVVFDPPRAGAEDQSKQIARSTVPLVAAVSCNPTTLARDLGILVAGGYRVMSITPLDQFLWSPHVEAVALLEKPKRRR